jgi:A/G-specific adenine glycosylase
LPWRQDRDPYRIWVSEIMLQQTQVATVVPYFLRFLKAFPTLQQLAAAEEQDVLRLWEGLGYYRRARDLHRAARMVVSQYDGQVPTDAAALRRLPGIGRYTAGAILSQAFDRRLPIVEANSLRVLCRVFGRSDDPRTGPMQHWLWTTAEALLPQRRVGDFNQALMELGALVCKPTAPACHVCPLRQSCTAHQLGLQESIPARAQAVQVVEVEESAVVLRRRGLVLIVQRPSGGRWGSLWEFPHGELLAGEPHDEAALRILNDQTGFRGELRGELLTVRHGVTRFRIRLVCFEAEHAGGRFRSRFYSQAQWIAPGELSAWPFSVPQRRIARALLQPVRQRRLF